MFLKEHYNLRLVAYLIDYIAHFSVYLCDGSQLFTSLEDVVEFIIT